MKHLKTYESIINIRILGIGILDITSLKEVLNSANKFNIKAKVYISKSNSNDLVIIFPKIYKDTKNPKYLNFIKNSNWSNFYTWYSIKYIDNTFNFIGTTDEKEIENQIELIKNTKKYNL